ncbi:MAG: hypothetical protein Kow0063_44360 [Anaerolineae bacterium]
MSTVTSVQVSKNSVVAGVVAGLGGGLLFGAMMAMQGMLPMVGMLVRQESSVVGFVVHMVISAIIGGGYGLVASRLPASWSSAIVGGAVYGVVWWVLGALILMPLMLGMAQMVLVLGGPQWMSLIGHLVFGVVTGILFLLLRDRV